MSQVDNRVPVAGEPQLSEVEPAARLEHAGSGRGGEQFVALRGFFAAPFTRVPDDLYSKIEHGNATRDRAAAVVHPHSRVSTNAYFGRFPASYWQRWTRATEVEVDAVVSGSGLVSVVASDFEGWPRVVWSKRVDHAQEHRLKITVALDRFVDGGALWLEAATDTGTLVVRDLRWAVPEPIRTRPTAVVLCTHNRPDDCLFTLRTLAENVESLSVVDVIYVIDQGDETVQSRPGFQRIKQAFGPKLRYRRQPNLGGAGGFTRGLYEIAGGRRAGHPNVIFMDDDILLEPDVIARMSVFANSTVEPVIVGSQMLHLLHPSRVHVSAETARFTTVEPGLAVPGSLNRDDVTVRHQELRVDADYTAWWCCLLPAEVVSDVGYPLPMFFQWDDVEYGYRARARGHATVTLPGAAVWHADFDWKDEDEWVRYFTLRNVLITDALHGDFKPRASARVALRWIFQTLVSMRYGQAATLIKAVEDFLAGPEVLHDGGARAIGELRALRAAYAETVPRSASDALGFPPGGRPMAKAGPPPSKASVVLAKRLVWQLLRRTGGRVSIPCRDAHWWHVSRFETAVVTDASQTVVRLRRVDRAKLVQLGKHALRVTLRLWRTGSQTQRQWRAAAPELAGRDNWSRLFNILSAVSDSAVSESEEPPGEARTSSAQPRAAHPA